MIKIQECREKATDLSSEYEISKTAVFVGLSIKKRRFILKKFFLNVATVTFWNKQKNNILRASTMFRNIPSQIFRRKSNIFPYSIQIWKNMDPKNSKYGHFSSSAMKQELGHIAKKNISSVKHQSKTYLLDIQSQYFFTSDNFCKLSPAHYFILFMIF